MRKGSLVVLLCALTAAATVQAAPDPAQELVFVGLRPLSSANGTGDITKLAEAQQIRKVAEAALADTIKQPVIGHDDLVRQAGKEYLVRWFKCQGRVGCVAAVLAPTTAAGYRTGMTGEYYSDGTTYHFRMVTFSINEGKISKEVDFDLPAGDVQNPDQWRAKLAPFTTTVSGHIKLTTNVSGATCKLDGKDCAFEADGQTISAPAGDHTLELSKEGYQNEKLIVTVKTGETEEVALELKQATKAVAVGPVGRMKPTLTAIRTDKRPDIDGKLDDAVWQKAWIETNFTQNFPDENTAPTQRTELRVLYDDEALYIGIRCYDTQPDAIIARLTRRDRDIESDKVTVDVSSKHDHASAYHFEVNAAGRQLDGLRSNDTDFSTDWDGLWYSAVTRDNLGWTAELEIPLTQLRYEGDTAAFGFQVRRYVQRRDEVDEWSYIPRTAQGEVSYYGDLEGLTGLNAQRLLQIVPYDSRSITIRSKQGPLDGNTTGGSFGADVKLGLTPALTLDATFNPDFGTVEVDQVVLNLSTTETYYPEKRPFFLEGADLFSTQLQLFYSRRIGRTPPATEINAPVVSPPPAGQIYGAAKVTGLLAHRLSIGLLDAVTAEEDTTIQREPDRPPVNVLADPLTNFGVLRLKQEFGENSYFGVMGTSVVRDEAKNAAAPLPGDPCPRAHGGLYATELPVDGRCTNDAYTADADTVLRTSDGKWGASGQIVGTLLENGPGRIIPDGTTVRPGELGWAAFTDFGKYGGENWLFHFYNDYETSNFEINDAGYNAVSNDETALAQLTLRTTKKWHGLLNTSLSANAIYEAYQDTNAPSTRYVFLRWLATLSNFWTVNLRYGMYLPYYNNRETRDGALLQSPSGYVASVNLGTDARKPVIVSAMALAQRTTRGANTRSNITVNMRPTSSVELDLISDFTYSFGDPRWVDTEPNTAGSRTYYFQDLDSRSFDVLLRGTWTFSPTLSLQTYVQLYLDSGHYGRVTSVVGGGAHPHLDVANFMDATLPGSIDDDFRDSALNINAFFRYEFRPGSLLWLVYTRAQDNEPYTPAEGIGRLRLDRLNGPSTDVFLVKLSYLWEPLRSR